MPVFRKSDAKTKMAPEHRAEKWMPVFRKSDAKTKI
jgi:hypothetical protein